MLKIGLLGAGRIAGVHAAAISQNPQSKLVAISDFYPEVADKLARQFDAVMRTNEDIIADPEIDAVLIATPTDTHAGALIWRHCQELVKVGAILGVRVPSNHHDIGGAVVECRPVLRLGHGLQVDLDINF